MNAQQLSENDVRLHALLMVGKRSARLPPHFQEQVWRRIARQELQPSVLFVLQTSVMQWINTVLSRPALAAAYVAVLLVIGASAGWAQARQQTARVSDEMSLRYVSSVDPYRADR